MHTYKLLIAVVAAGIIATPFAPPMMAQTASASFDRAQPPPVPPAKPLSFPKAQRRTLENGIPLIILEDHTEPVVSVSAVLQLSPMLDPAGKSGLGAFVNGLIGEGTTQHTADQLSDIYAALGNRVSAGGFYTIPANVDRSLDLMAEQFLQPAFPQSSIDRIKANALANIERAKQDPNYIAGRILADKLYGRTHPYAREVTAADVRAITREDIVAYYQTYYRPPNIKIIVAGDMTPDQAVAKLNRVFGNLKPGKVGLIPVPPVSTVASAAVYLYDRPGSPQSILLAAQLGPPRHIPDLYAIELMNTALGSAFNSRLNMNLREQHQYAYGASSGFSFRRSPEPSTFNAQAAVETSKTDSAVIELMKEIRGIRTTTPMTAEELAFGKASAIKTLPLQFETIGQRAGAVTQLVTSDEPLDYYNTVIQKYNGVTLAQAQAAAKKYLDPSRMILIVVGDRKAVEPGLRAAGVAPVVVIDSL